MSDNILDTNLKKINYLDDFENLNLSNKEYVITGSAACILYGWPTENHDIDIFVNPFKLQMMIDNDILKQDELNQNKYKDKSGNWWSIGGGMHSNNEVTRESLEDITTSTWVPNCSTYAYYKI